MSAEPLAFLTPMVARASSSATAALPSKCVAPLIVLGLAVHVRHTARDRPALEALEAR